MRAIAGVARSYQARGRSLCILRVRGDAAWEYAPNPDPSLPRTREPSALGERSGEGPSISLVRGQMP